MSEYFPKPKSLRANVKGELDLSNYATKADLKVATGVASCKLHWILLKKESDLANLKSDVDKGLFQSPLLCLYSFVSD